MRSQIGLYYSHKNEIAKHCDEKDQKEYSAFVRKYRRECGENGSEQMINLSR